MYVNEKLIYRGSIPSRPQEALKKLRAFFVYKNFLEITPNNLIKKVAIHPY